MLGDSYVLVDREEVMEALAYYVGSFVANHPDASLLSPKELQTALTAALRDLKKSRSRRLWDWGKRLHRVGAVAYGTAGAVAYAPWLLQATAMALYSGLRVCVGVVTGY
jgi:hypothetical protein